MFNEKLFADSLVMGGFWEVGFEDPTGEADFAMIHWQGDWPWTNYETW